MEGPDKIWQERILLIQRDSVWDFEVTGSGENQPTVFRLTNIGSESFNSENAENEFPKVISYYRDGSKLHAVISGGDNKIPFEFEPVTGN